MDFDRRTILSAGAAAVATGGAASARNRPISQPAPTKDGYSALNPDEALDLLIRGNEAFLSDRAAAPTLSAKRRLELAKGQAPFCAYVSCSDSRVPPELLFGRGLGELFIIRNAGNTIDTAALGSLQFAVAVLRVPLVVVMGHEACGAVKAAQAVVESNATFPGAIGDMIQPIIPAALAARDESGKIETENATRENVRRFVKRLRTESDPLLLDPQKEGRLKVVGAYYELGRGSVDFFDRV